MSEEKLDAKEKKWAIPFLFIWTIIFAVLFYPFVRKFFPKQIHDAYIFVSIGIIFVSIIYTTGIIFQYKTDLKNHKKRIVRWAYSFVKYAFIFTIFLFFPLYIWSNLHQLPINGFHFYGLSLFIGLALGAAEAFVTKPKLSDNSIFWRTVQLIALPAAVLSIFLIVSLLLLDIITFFTTPNLDVLYPNPEIKSFLFTLYTGALAIIAFGVTLYVAYIRHSSLKLSEKQFEHTQQQFSYTQTQKQEEEIEKRFQEGIKLLGNEQESIRLGGIFVLWEIVKDAVKALPYLENEYVYYAEYTDDKEQIYILPCRLELPKNNLDTTHQKVLKDHYLEIYPSSKVQIGAYLKAFSLHEQILNILCAYIRTKTNHENYIKENYPSIFQKRYPHKFKEAFGVKGEFNHIEESEEKPSYEIQNLLDLLLKIPYKEQKQGRTLNKNLIPNHALDFKLNLSQTILKGADFNNASFENADCNQANFQHTSCKSAHFNRASLCKTAFQNAMCLDASFEEAICFQTIFETAQLIKTSFQNTNCEMTNFKNANCIGSGFQYAILSYADFQSSECNNINFQHAKIIFTQFQNTKCNGADFQHTSFQFAYFQNADCSYANFQHAELKNVDLKNADCSCTNFNDTIFLTPNFQNTNITETTFNNSNITNVDLQYAMHVEPL